MSNGHKACVSAVFSCEFYSVTFSILCTGGINAHTADWSITGSNIRWDERSVSSPQRPDVLWGPPSHLHSGYRGFLPGIKRLRNGLKQRLRMSGAMPPRPCIP